MRCCRPSLFKPNISSVPHDSLLLKTGNSFKEHRIATKRLIRQSRWLSTNSNEGRGSSRNKELELKLNQGGSKIQLNEVKTGLETESMAENLLDVDNILKPNGHIIKYSLGDLLARYNNMQDTRGEIKITTINEDTKSKMLNVNIGAAILTSIKPDYQSTILTFVLMRKCNFKREIIYPFNVDDNQASKLKDSLNMPKEYVLDKLINLGSLNNNLYNNEESSDFNNIEFSKEFLQASIRTMKATFSYLSDPQGYMVLHNKLKDVEANNHEKYSDPDTSSFQEFSFDLNNELLWQLDEFLSSSICEKLVQYIKLFRDKHDNHLINSPIYLNLHDLGKAILDSEIFESSLKFELSKYNLKHMYYDILSDSVLNILSFKILSSLLHTKTMQLSSTLFSNKKVISSRELLAEFQMVKSNNNDSLEENDYILCLRPKYDLSLIRYLSGQLVSNVTIIQTKRTKSTQHALKDIKIQSELLFYNFLNDLEFVYGENMALFKPLITQRNADFKTFSKSYSKFKKQFKINSKNPLIIDPKSNEVLELFKTLPKSTYTYLYNDISNKLNVENSESTQFKLKIISDRPKTMVIEELGTSNDYDDTIIGEEKEKNSVVVPYEMRLLFVNKFIEYIIKLSNSSENESEHLEINHKFEICTENNVIIKDLNEKMNRLSLTKIDENYTKLVFKNLDFIVKKYEKYGIISDNNIDMFQNKKGVNGALILFEDPIVLLFNEFLFSIIQERKTFKAKININVLISSLMVLRNKYIFDLDNDSNYNENLDNIFWTEINQPGQYQNAGDRIVNSSLSLLADGSIPNGSLKANELSKLKGSDKDNMESIILTVQRRIGIIKSKLSSSFLNKYWSLVENVLKEKECNSLEYSDNMKIIEIDINNINKIQKSIDDNNKLLNDYKKEIDLAKFVAEDFVLRKKSCIGGNTEYIKMQNSKLYQGIDNRNNFEKNITYFEGKIDDLNNKLLTLYDIMDRLKSKLALDVSINSKLDEIVQFPQDILFRWEESYDSRKFKLKTEYSWWLRKEKIHKIIQNRIGVLISKQRGPSVRKLSYRRSKAIVIQLLKEVTNEHLAKKNEYPKYFPDEMVQLPRFYRAINRINVGYISRDKRYKYRNDFSYKKKGKFANLDSAAGFIPSQLGENVKNMYNKDRNRLYRRELPSDVKVQNRIIEFYKYKAKILPLENVSHDTRIKLREMFKLRRRILEQPWVIKTAAPYINIPWLGIRIRGDIAESVAYEEPYLPPIKLEEHGDYLSLIKSDNYFLEEAKHFGGGALDLNQLLYHGRCHMCQSNIVKPISKTAYLSGTVVILCSECKFPHRASDNLGLYSCQSPHGITNKKDLKILPSYFEPVLKFDHNYGSGYNVEVVRFKFFDQALSLLKSLFELDFVKYIGGGGIEFNNGTSRYLPSLKEDKVSERIMDLFHNKGISRFKNTTDYLNFIREEFARKNLHLIAGMRPNDLKIMKIKTFIDYQDGNPNSKWILHVDPYSGYKFYLNSEGEPDFIIDDIRQKKMREAQIHSRALNKEKQLLSNPSTAIEDLEEDDDDSITSKRGQRAVFTKLFGGDKHESFLTNGAINRDSTLVINDSNINDTEYILNNLSDSSGVFEEYNLNLMDKYEKIEELRSKRNNKFVETILPFKYADFSNEVLNDNIDFPKGALRDKLMARARRWNKEYLEFRRKNYQRMHDSLDASGPKGTINVTGNKLLDYIISTDSTDIKLNEMRRRQNLVDKKIYNILYNLRRFIDEDNVIRPTIKLSSPKLNLSDESNCSKTVDELLKDMDEDIDRWAIEIARENLRQIRTNNSIQTSDIFINDLQNLIQNGLSSDFMDPKDSLYDISKDILDADYKDNINFLDDKDLHTDDGLLIYMNYMAQVGDDYDNFLNKKSYFDKLPIEMEPIKEIKIFNGLDVNKLLNEGKHIEPKYFKKRLGQYTFTELLNMNLEKPISLNAYSAFFTEKGLFTKEIDGVKYRSDIETGKLIETKSLDYDYKQLSNFIRKIPEDEEEIEDDLRTLEGNLKYEKEKLKRDLEQYNKSKLKKGDTSHLKEDKKKFDPPAHYHYTISDTVGDTPAILNDDPDIKLLRFANVIMDREKFPLRSQDDIKIALEEIQGKTPLLSSDDSNYDFGKYHESAILKLNPLGRPMKVMLKDEILNDTKRKSNINDNLILDLEPFSKKDENKNSIQLIKRAMQKFVDRYSKLRRNEINSMFTQMDLVEPDVEFVGTIDGNMEGHNGGDAQVFSPESYDRRVKMLMKAPFYGISADIESIEDEEYRLYLERLGIGDRVTENFYLEEYLDMSSPEYSPISCPEMEDKIKAEKRVGVLLEESRFKDNILLRKREYFRQLADFESQMLGLDAKPSIIKEYPELDLIEDLDTKLKRNARDIYENRINTMNDRDLERRRKILDERLRSRLPTEVVDAFYKDLETGDICLSSLERKLKWRNLETGSETRRRELDSVKHLMSGSVIDNVFLARLFLNQKNQYLKFINAKDISKTKSNKQLVKKRIEALGGEQSKQKLKEFDDKFHRYGLQYALSNSRERMSLLESNIKAMRRNGVL